MVSSVRWFLAVVVGLVLLPSALVAQTTGDTAPGVQLPAPFGIGLTLYDQTQDYALQNLTLGLPGIGGDGFSDLPVDNRTDSYHLKLDWWALPFLNLYAIGGRLETTTTVYLRDAEVPLPIPLGNLRIENDGWVYGGGVTLAVGWNRWFATVSTTYTRADLEVTDGSVEAWVVTPKIGRTFNGAAAYVGAMYQDAEERHRGTYELPFIGPVPFEVVLGEASHWSGLLGATVGFGEHVMLLIEGGFGARKSVMVSLEYRP
jgi:hypothetical protein